LGFSSEHGVRLVFERYGLLKTLRRRGFEPHIRFDLQDPTARKLRIYDGVEDPHRLLIELTLAMEHRTLPNGYACEVLFINWLLMQDPYADFPPDHTPLPDQNHPGLGLFLRFGYLMRLTTMRLQCDGLVNHPAHFHNGVLYGKFCHFVDPMVEGRFLALKRDLEHLSLADATWALDNGRVFDAKGRVVSWLPVDQMMPTTRGAQAWFESKRYKKRVERARLQWRFHVA